MYQLILLLIASTSIMSAETSTANAISQTGTISFILQTDKNYYNGQGQEDYKQELVTLPGHSTISFNRNDSVVNIRWVWEDRAGFPKFYDTVVDFHDLPGPESYFLQFTWDSARGISQAYINGIPLRLPGTTFAPWWVKHPIQEIQTGTGNLQVVDLQLSNAYTPPNEALAGVPEGFHDKHKELIGKPKPQQPSTDINQRKGKRLYQSSLANPQSVKGWVAEGPLHLRFEEDALLMRSINDEQHTVFWCPMDFPESFIAEWDFEVLSHYGLAIVFFAAKGENGEDIFAPSLPPRDGHFKHYIGGAITSYHISYFANVENFQMGRTDSNLRKNNKFYRVGGGPTAVLPDSKGWQRIRLVKDGNRIQLYNNDTLYVDWTDNQAGRYGKPHNDGKIGFRQMTTTTALYRNFKVWNLKSKEAQ